LAINYLEQQYQKKNLFKNEENLEISYLPEKILHREQELILLSKIFIKLIENPFLISRKVLIQGEIGIGKTIITRIFANMLLLSAEKRNLNIKYVHINCRKEKTSYKVLFQILKTLGNPVPIRGFSPQELITILQEFLERKKIYLLLTLDELNYLQNTKFDLIYAFTRMNDSNSAEKNYLSLITIIRNLTVLRNLDESTISTLQGNVITLKKYKKHQIVDILSQRIESAVKDGVISDEILNRIADNIIKSGDIRKALNIIRNCVKIAESKDHIIVSNDDLNLVLNDLLPSIHDDILSILSTHQNILLKSITDIIINEHKGSIPISDVKNSYYQLCSQYNEIPRKNTQIWKNLQLLKNYNIIQIEIISEKIKGRTSFCSISEIPLDVLNKRLIQKLDQYIVGVKNDFRNV
jgi:archaeal cell division control protein 6